MIDGAELETRGAVKSWALHLWANYIETGDISLSAKDSKLPRPLELNQQKLVLKLRELANEELKDQKLFI